MSAPEPTPVLSPEELAERLDELRRDDPGIRIVLTNGCFDLLHPGHVRYLAAAAERGDLLVVGINADDTVRRLKGAGRPVLAARHRAEVLAALAMVDFVTVFQETTADRLIELLRPDVHCKGSDYDRDGVPEAETVRDVGGEVAIVGGPKEFDTSELLARIRATEP